jgi:hypothetical protein
MGEHEAERDGERGPLDAREEVEVDARDGVVARRRGGARWRGQDALTEASFEDEQGVVAVPALAGAGVESALARGGPAGALAVADARVRDEALAADGAWAGAHAPHPAGATRRRGGSVLASSDPGGRPRGHVEVDHCS